MPQIQSTEPQRMDLRQHPLMDHHIITIIHILFTGHRHIMGPEEIGSWTSSASNLTSSLWERSWLSWSFSRRSSSSLASSAFYFSCLLWSRRRRNFLPEITTTRAVICFGISRAWVSSYLVVNKGRVNLNSLFPESTISRTLSNSEWANRICYDIDRSLFKAAIHHSSVSGRILILPIQQNVWCGGQEVSNQKVINRVYRHFL